MSLFGRQRSYDRERLLREAREVQPRGKHQKTVRLLREILIVEPDNPEIHALIAPSLAERGLEFCAWDSYGRAATGLLRDGNEQPALDAYRDPTQRMPRHYEAWASRIALERSMGRSADAKSTLKSALSHFRRRATRYALISQLRLLLELDPAERGSTLELAFVLSKTGQKREALMLLLKLGEASEGRFLRQLRRVQWNIEPSLLNSWLWLRSRIAS